MHKLVLEKAEKPEIKLPTFVGSQRKQENSRKTSASASLTTQKPLTVDHSKLWKILKGMRIPDHLACLLWNLYVGQKQQLEPYNGTTGSELGKEYNKVVCITLFI